MPSIINGLFAGRSGISSHGNAIAVIGDNISNSSTPGYKQARAEFEDLVAGGQAAGKVVGSGSQTSAVSTINQQGTLEFTGRTLDLGIDGNGYFIVQDGSQKFYTRAGNFRVNSAGIIVSQNDLPVLGFSANGSGALEQLNINQVSQSQVSTSAVTVSGNLNAADATNATPATSQRAGTAAPGVEPTTYAALSAAANFSTVVDVLDPLGATHTVTLFFFKNASNDWEAQAYVNSDDVDTGTPAQGYPRLVGTASPAGGTTEFGFTFNTDGSLNTTTSTANLDLVFAWNNGSTSVGNNHTVSFDLSNFNQFASNSNVSSITQDGQGIGTVTSLSIRTDGQIFALLDNGQSAVIGTIGLVNFSNPEGLTRIGKNLLQQSGSSGEPVVGQPQAGTLGSVQSGAIELSTVDIADNFVKLITLQRGFQANSRIITTINQLLNEIIQLA